MRWPLIRLLGSWTWRRLLRVVRMVCFSLRRGGLCPYELGGPVLIASRFQTRRGREAVPDGPSRDGAKPTETCVGGSAS